MSSSPDMQECSKTNSKLLCQTNTHPAQPLDEILTYRARHACSGKMLHSLHHNISG